MKRYIPFLLTLTCLNAVSQSGKNDSLTQSFLSYQAQAPSQKIFVHLDKTTFLAGEIAWFRIYDVEGSLHRPFPGAGIADIEILNKDQKPVMQARIALREGTGNGTFVIPSNIPSGNYMLRAYTSWMKNFSPELYFHQPLTIINTLKEEPAAIPGTAAGQDLPPTPSIPALTVTLFPEGGNLVTGLPSVLGIKAANQYGYGTDCHGFILDQKNDTVARFITTRFGMGHFDFTPKKGDRYSAWVIAGQTHMPVPVKIPAPYDEGYVMHLEETGDNKLKITVRCNILSTDPDLYLFINTRSFIKGIQQQRLKENTAIFYLDKNNLGDGVSQLTVFNAARSPVCERLCFKAPADQLHITEQLLQPEYLTREKIDLALLTTINDGRPQKASLSMSAFLLDSLQQIPSENILTYFLLSSELKGKIENPAYYFENSGPDAREAMENLLLTQGWTRFRWEDLLQNKRPYFEFLSESGTSIINGKIINRLTGTPAPSILGYLSVPGKHFEFVTAQSDNEGNIQFNIPDFYGTGEIIAQTNGLTDSNYRVDISYPFSDKFSTRPFSEFSLPSTWHDQLLRRSISAQVENTYQIKLRRNFLPPAIHDTFPFYGLPDRAYNLDDYTRFTTQEEVIKEYVLDAHIRRQSGKSHFQVKNALFDVFFENDPLLLIDGLPVFDVEKLLSIDPLKIREIDVIPHKYYIGPMVSEGIISYKTYEGDLGGYTLDANAVALQYNGLQQEREFYAPAYESPERKNSPIPDFRNLLQWSPDLRTDEQGKQQLSFYTSDLTGKFAIIVQGMTPNGLAGYKILTFTVKK